MIPFHSSSEWSLELNADVKYNICAHVHGDIEENYV